jgi:hypothetical protein
MEERVNEAEKKPQGWNLRGNTEEHQRTGALGGETTKERKGPDYYREIGKKGGTRTAQSQDMAKIGRTGGEARAAKYRRKARIQRARNNADTIPESDSQAQRS